MSRKAIFLDKDGTLVANVPYNVNPALLTLMPGVSLGLERLATLPFLLIIVTNQAGIARGEFTADDFRRHIQTLSDIFRSHGCKLTDVYYCPHDPQGKVAAYSVECECRKPQCGLLRRAGREHKIDLSQSWMVGDILDDIEAGHRAGCRSILVNTGGEDQWIRTPEREPNATVARFDHAVEFLINAQPRKKEKHATVE